MNLNLNAHALSVIAQVRDAVYSERTRVNTIAKDRRSTIGTLSEGLPPSSDDGEWAMALEDVTADLVALRKEAAVRRAENAETRAKAREQALNLFHLKKSSVEEEAEAAIRKIRKDAAAKIAVLETERDAEFQKADDRLRKAQDSADKDVREKESGLVARKAEAEAIVAQQAKSRSTRELIERHKKELAKAEETSKTLTAAIDHLDKLKTRVSSESPIPGLDITPDGLVLDGVPFRIVNEAERTRVAFELAKILVGECKTIMIDNLEHLDDENKAIFKQAAMDSGLQVIAACVANHPLQVAIDEEAQVAHATV
jgi:vacuolar-type H+-ATPase subunit I/STV1